MDWFASTVLVPLLLIFLLVLIHEFGHFIVAKWCGVGVVKFSVGLGPSLFRFTRGETIYQLSAIPLGGFVRMIGDMPDMITGPQAGDDLVRDESDLDQAAANAGLTAEEASPAVRAMLADRSRWFIEKPLAQRAAIVFAGPLFNFILAVVLAFGAGLTFGVESLDPAPRIGEVVAGSPAEFAGLKSGDLIVTIDAEPIDDWAELTKLINYGDGHQVVMEVDRGGVRQKLSVQPQLQETSTLTGQKIAVYRTGIGPSLVREQVDFTGAVEFGFLWAYDKAAATLMGIGGMFMGHASTSELAGPKFIFDQAAKHAKRGIESTIYFGAFLSITLAVLNLLPIPILDGGHLLFFLIEAIIGPISIRKKEIAQGLGMVFLLTLMLVAIRNDFSRDYSKLEKGATFAPPSNPPANGAAPGTPAEPVVAK